MRFKMVSFRISITSKELLLFAPSNIHELTRSNEILTRTDLFLDEQVFQGRYAGGQFWQHDVHRFRQIGQEII